MVTQALAAARQRCTLHSAPKLKLIYVPLFWSRVVLRARHWLHLVTSYPLAAGRCLHPPLCCPRPQAGVREDSALVVDGLHEP